MRIEQVTNMGVTNLYQELKAQFKSCESFCIGSAFISGEAIELLDTFLTQNSYKSRQGRILIGLLNRFNKQTDLCALQILEQKHAGRLAVGISRNPHFHWKYYAFTHRQKHVLFIGSANFTSSGLGRDGEWLVKLSVSGKRGAVLMKEWQTTFFSEWEAAIPIATFPVSLYKEVAIREATSPYSGLHPAIQQLMKQQLKTPRGKSEKGTLRVILITGFVAKKTMKILGSFQPHWEQRGWDYYTCDSKSEYIKNSKAETFLLIWRERGTYWFYWAEQLDKCQAPLTPDGKYFIAYQELARPKRETKRIQEMLEGIRVHYHSRNFRGKTLGKNQAQQLKEQLT